ncbi:MAG TPA: transcription termination factor NusA [Bryobacteraceae bacterium]|nr:transcription termination factor NusA [Bryobacteraceae bacterium]
MASIYQSIEILSKEKGIDPQIILDAVKDAMLVAARKQFRTEEELAADFDPKTGAITIYVVKTVVEQVTEPLNQITLEDARALDPAAEPGGQVRIARPTEVLGRISAQTAKQVILQKVREAERENVFAEFSSRVGDLVNCVIKRIEGQDMVVDLGKTEARLPKKEQSRLESFSIGERVRCVIKSVEKMGKNAGVMVSRAAAEFVMRLFEQEVPEIYDGTVIIRGCAREAGERTKIAVLSRDRDVDCVGACVGMKGMRVQSIIRELRGEKIDIIEFSEDPAAFATHALSPARISRVAILDTQERHMEVIVEDAQLSLAIGKKGQNVRLAAKLMGWKIDIKTEEEKRQEVEAAMNSMAATPLSILAPYGLSEEALDALLAGGVATVEKVGSMTPEELEGISGVSPEVIQQVVVAVNAYYGQPYAGAEQAAAQEPDTAIETPAGTDRGGAGRDRGPGGAGWPDT